MTAMLPQRLIHIPTPGDHYSPATGSAVMTIIYELTRRHDAAGGGQSMLLVKPGTRHDYPVGQCIEVPFGELPTKSKKLVDAAVGRLGLSRPFGASIYRPACSAIDRDFAGTILVWNNPAPLLMLRKHAPHAKLCLYAQNSLFRTYSQGETRRILACADRVICCSQFIANELAKKVQQPEDNIRAVVNGVDTDRFSPAPSPPMGIPIVLFVGRVLPEKGPDLLIRAALKIQNPNRPFRLRIVGSSNFSATDPLTAYEQQLRELAKPLGDAITFRPFVDRSAIIEEYQSASIFCVPSNWDEPVSLTVSEAMACGLPTIASRRGGIPEAGGDALLYFNPPDIDELAKHLAMLLDNPAARSQWGLRARQQAMTISWNRQYQLFCQALSNGATSH